MGKDLVSSGYPRRGTRARDKHNNTTVHFEVKHHVAEMSASHLEHDELAQISQALLKQVE